MLAAVPIVAIAAIVLGDIALRAVNRARDIAEPNHIQGSGKYMTARILSQVGLYGGIAALGYWLVDIIRTIAEHLPMSV